MFNRKLKFWIVKFDEPKSQKVLFAMLIVHDVDVIATCIVK